MIIDNAIDTKVNEILLAENKKKREEHISSGKLTASMLGWPLQWQVLKVLGVPPKEPDDYTIRKFIRGEHVEEWLLSHINPLETQKDVEFKNCVGKIDALVDTANWERPVGVIPLEVKSVKASNWQYILKSGPSRGHILQACLYALAENSPYFAVCSVVADDYRIKTFVFETEKYRSQVEDLIYRFDLQLPLGVPIFQEEEPWQKNLQYNSYPEWINLNQEQINQKIHEITKN